MKDLFPIDKPGYVYSFTSVAGSGNGSGLEQPAIVALIKFESVKGGIVHRLQVNRPEEAIGTRVEPLLEERTRRTGALTDIRAFKPVKSGS